MNVELEYTAQLKRALGRGRESLEFADGAVLFEVMSELSARYGDAAREVLYLENGDLNPSIALFVNDKQVFSAAETRIRDGDRVTLLCPIAGG